MFKRILIATDGSKNGEKAAKSGIELAKLSGGKVIIVYVADIGKYMPSAGIISPAPRLMRSNDAFILFINVSHRPI